MIDRDDELRDAYRERRSQPNHGCMHVLVGLACVPVAIVWIVVAVVLS